VSKRRLTPAGKCCETQESYKSLRVVTHSDRSAGTISMRTGSHDKYYRQAYLLDSTIAGISPYQLPASSRSSCMMWYLTPLQSLYEIRFGKYWRLVRMTYLFTFDWSFVEQTTLRDETTNLLVSQLSTSVLQYTIFPRPSQNPTDLWTSSTPSIKFSMSKVMIRS
jgi:hypothetical protein